jgi:hypothetical protein
VEIIEEEGLIEAEEVNQERRVETSHFLLERVALEEVVVPEMRGENLMRTIQLLLHLQHHRGLQVLTL